MKDDNISDISTLARQDNNIATCSSRDSNKCVESKNDEDIMNVAVLIDDDDDDDEPSSKKRKAL